MGLLAGTAYDPGTAASVSTASLLAMTAIDTTNLRLTFTAPAAGPAGSVVRVRMKGATSGATPAPTILMGVLDHSNSDAVAGRQAPFVSALTNGTNIHSHSSVDFLVGGLTAGASKTFDAAYGVETVQASSVLKWGGPNNNSGANAWGSFIFEIYDTPGLLAFAQYDPGTSASVSLGTLSAMAAVDTTNLRLSFTAPASGNVVVRLRTVAHGGTAKNLGSMLGALDHTNGDAVKMRQGFPYAFPSNTLLATDFYSCPAVGLVTGLTVGASYTFDAAWAVQTVVTSTSFVWGGPNDTTGDNAFGGFAFDIWDAASYVPTGALI